MATNSQKVGEQSHAIECNLRTLRDRGFWKQCAGLFSVKSFLVFNFSR